MPVPSAATSRTIDLPALCVRAAIAPSSINKEDRSVDVTFSTGAPVTRYDWMTGTRYIERLSMKPEHVRLERLNSGAPLLNSHSGYDLSDVLGVVEDGSAQVKGKKGVATVRFSKRDNVEPIFQDVLDGVIRNVSVGYFVHKSEETTGKDGSLPTRLAIDWEPYEISMVPMPADAGAQTRDGKPAALHPCVIETRSAHSADEQENPVMPEAPITPESIVERNPNDPGAPIAPSQTLAIRAVEEPNDHDRGSVAMLARVRGIIDAGRAARMSQEFIDKIVDDPSISLVDAQTRIFDELRRRGYDHNGPSNVTVRERSLDGDTNVHQTEGIKEALLHRLAPQHFELTERGRLYRGLTVMDTAKIYLQARGLRTTDLTRNEIAGVALTIHGRGVGMHTTSDFPYLLEDVARKSVKKAFDELPQSWRQLASPITLTNYQPVKIVQFGDAPELLEVLEHGEYTSGTTGEGREQIQLRKWGRKFGITREAMINDDLSAFSKIPANFGRKARAKESDIVWEQIATNPTMGDGNALFSIAHNNLAVVDAAIAIASLGAARTALRQQRSVDGEYVNLPALFLIVPPGMETLAEQYVTLVQATANSAVNPFSGKLTVVTDPRLTNEDEWYVATGPAFEWLVYAYLEGEEGPQVETRPGFDIDGLEFKCRLEFAAKVADWRGIYKNEGAT